MGEEFKQLPTRTKALFVFLGLAAVSLIVSWYSPAGAPSKDFVTTTPIKGTAVAKVATPVKSGTVHVIPKKIVKQSIINLPPEIDQDNVEVIDTAAVPPSENGYEVLTTIRTDTGDTKSYLKENPPPLFAFESKGRVGLGYGISTAGPVSKVFGEWSFVRIGNAHLSAQTELNFTPTRDPEIKAMAIADIRLW